MLVKVYKITDGKQSDYKSFYNSSDAITCEIKELFNKNYIIELKFMNNPFMRFEYDSKNYAKAHEDSNILQNAIDSYKNEIDSITLYIEAN
jgi:hypothetical protein